MSGTVLITGATGFTGSFLAEQYSAEGWQVHGTFVDEIGSAETSPPCSLHRVDLRHSASVRALIGARRPDVIHHLAAQSSVSRSWADPAETITGNTIMQLNLLEAVAIEAPGARVVVVGSCDEYGNVEPWENPVSESAELRPTSPYALSKVSQDLMGYQYAVARDLDVVRVRPFLQLGPRRPARFVAGSFARQVAEIELCGEDATIEVGNIDLVRDFTDVRDVASALVAVADRGAQGEVYNIASGTEHTLRELLSIMMGEANVRATIHESPALRRPGEPQTLIGDASRLRRASGWEPRISFKESAVATLEYWRGRLRKNGETVE